MPFKIVIFTTLIVFAMDSNLSKVDTDINQSDEISIYDIYEFFVEGWKTIGLFAIVSCIVGVTLAYILPTKFEASGLIDVATVAEASSAMSAIRAVESKDVLAEKLKSPTYFSSDTIQTCGYADRPNPAKALTDELVSSVQRNSNFVSVKIKASSPEMASGCLEAILKDVQRNQALLAAPIIDNNTVALKTVEEQLQAAKTEQLQLLAQNQERLDVARKKLAAAQSFVDQFSKDAITFKFDNPQFSASALLLSTLTSKQNEVKDLEILINQLQMEVDAKITRKDNDVRELAKRSNDLRNALSPPQTKQASFATPIYSPNQRVEPKRSLIVVIATIAGVFGGVLWLLIGNIIRREKMKHATLKSS